MHRSLAKKDTNMEGTTGARIHALTSFGDDGLQLIALEELNQMLSLGQQGEFRVSAYVPALIKVISLSLIHI